jgi:hypothetical protein
MTFNRDEFKNVLIARGGGTYDYGVIIGHIPDDRLHDYLVARKERLIAQLIASLPNERTWAWRATEREERRYYLPYGYAMRYWILEVTVREVPQYGHFYEDRWGNSYNLVLPEPAKPSLWQRIRGR